MLKKTAMVVALCLIAAGGWAETRTLVFQYGLNGYHGAEDVFLYAPASVADVNYGKNPQLPTGRNLWGEDYVTLMRFNLSAVPADATVKDATLFLYDVTKEWPNEEILVESFVVAPANAEWADGSNTGTRVPIEGTCCWNWLAYGEKRWAGKPGMREKGVDYLPTVVGSVSMVPDHEGWVRMGLDGEVVRSWLGQESNPGLVFVSRPSEKKGQVAVFAAAEYAEDILKRPKLVLEVEMDDGAWRTFLGEETDRALSALREEIDSVVKNKAGYRKDAGAASDQLIREFEKRTEQIGRILESKNALSEKHLELLQKDIDRVKGDMVPFADRLAVARAADANLARSIEADFALGVADSMTNVLREPRKLDASFDGVAEISMAQNEFESFQVVLVPIEGDLKKARWSVSDLRSENGAKIPASDVSAQVMGYMKSLKPAVNSDSAWWPVPVLDFMDSVDVPSGEVQPLWVTVHTREDTPAGVYSGTIKVKAPGREAKEIRLNVNVWDFAVPKEQHLLTFWGNVEGAYQRLYGDKYDKKMAREMMDFLLDHRLAVNTLYSQQATGEPQANAHVGYPTLSDPQELKRLWDAGSRWWNLGYAHPVFPERAGKSWDEYLPDFVEMLKESLRVADAAGWPRSNMTIYLFDETKEFELLDRVARYVKEAFPDIQLMTTAYDRSYGVKGGPIDESIDIWCPLTPIYVQDVEVIEKAREKGKKVWWYVCCGPRNDPNLNFFCQFPAIRSRLLMGTANWKYKPDGFLYYRISGWNRYEKPIDSGPLTDWKPYFLPGPDGDGELICPGPNGPLTTLQFENIRDGMEDYEYYWVLKDLVAQAKAKGIDADDAAKLLEVPEDLMKTITDYSEEPNRLREERESIAGAILELKKRLEQ